MLWNAYVTKNPSFLTGPTTFTPAGLRKFFDQTYDHGYGEGKEDEKGGAMFEQLFGKGFKT